MAIQKVSGVADQYLEDLRAEIIRQHTPNKGWCDLEHCTACIEAESKIDAAIDAAQRGYAISAYEAQVEEGEERQVQERIFKEGFAAGKEQATQIAHRWANQAASEAAAAAKSHWYQRGLREGRLSAPKPPPMQAVNEKSLRKKFFDEALDDCHIIGESNPQMKPAANAIRHRLKKRMK